MMIERREIRKKKAAKEGRKEEVKGHESCSMTENQKPKMKGGNEYEKCNLRN